MELYRKPQGLSTRWSSFENPSAAKGQAARTNRGWKGNAFEWMQPGETKTLLDVQGSGTVQRIWVTHSGQKPRMLRSMRIDMYWEGESRPAVSAPFGDFFGIALGRKSAFESTLFSDPEGRSFNCFVPMPFRKAARITVTNESDQELPHLFYEVNCLIDVEHPADMHYFHAHWRRESPNALGKDYDILPLVHGSGRYIGCNVGIMVDPTYNAWWGEGEFKAWIDGDTEHPTLCGTGTEDFVGAAWGLGRFSNLSQGCLVADDEKKQWCFYRYHTVDPVYFDQDFRAAIQTIGGCDKKNVIELLAQGRSVIPVSINSTGAEKFCRLGDLAQPVDLSDPSIPEGWCNFWRQDDWSSTAYFYLDRPVNELPPLASLDERTARLEDS
jgi:hypothetical protein